MRSTQGEIEVFLCPDEPVPKPSASLSPTEPSTSKSRTLSQHPVSNLSHYSTGLETNNRNVKKEPLLSSENIKMEHNLTPPSSSAGMRDALLGELNEFNLVPRKVYHLQSEEQHQPLGMNKFIYFYVFQNVSSSLFCFKFVSLSSLFLYHFYCHLYIVTI